MLGVGGEVEVAAVGDALEFLRLVGEREHVLDVGGADRVVGEFLLALFARLEVVALDAERAVPLLAQVAPVLVPLHRLVRAGRRTRSPSARTRGERKVKFRGLISLRNAFPTCAIPNGSFSRVESRTFGSWRRCPGRFRGGGRPCSRPTAIGPGVALEHQVERPRLGELPASPTSGTCTLGCRLRDRAGRAAGVTALTWPSRARSSSTFDPAAASRPDSDGRRLPARRVESRSHG